MTISDWFPGYKKCFLLPIFIAYLDLISFWNNLRGFWDLNNANSYIKNIQMWILQNPQKSNISYILLMMRTNQLQLQLLLSCMRSSWAALILNWNDIRALLGFKNRKSKWDDCLSPSLHPINLRNTESRFKKVNCNILCGWNVAPHWMCHRNRASTTFSTIINTDNELSNDKWMATNDRQHVFWNRVSIVIDC